MGAAITAKKIKRLGELTMPLSINSNIASLNAQRNLNNSQSVLSTFVSLCCDSAVICIVEFAVAGCHQTVGA